MKADFPHNQATVAGKMRVAYRIALLCGGIPLIAGSAIFSLWLATHWLWLMLAGICTIYSGLVLFLIGIIALARFCWLGLRPTNHPRRRLFLSTLGAAALLLSNFPVAAAIFAAVIAIMGHHHD